MSQIQRASGGPIRAFVNGWAIIPFGGDRVHYFEQWNPRVPAIFEGERVKYYRALCGIEKATYKGVPALAGGGFDRCERCRQLLVKRTPKVQQ